jgi:rod shape-determining protein MreD
VVAVTWCYGARVGMAWACLGGILVDLTATGPIGPHALALLCGAYLTGMWVRNVHRDSALHTVLAAALSTVVYSLVLIAADDTLGLPVPPLFVAAQITFAACVYNAVLTPLGLGLMRRLGSTKVEAAA